MVIADSSESTAIVYQVYQVLDNTWQMYTASIYCLNSNGWKKALASYNSLWMSH